MKQHRLRSDRGPLASPHRRHTRRPEEWRFFTVAEVAEFIGVSVRTIRRLIASGDLPVHRFAGTIRISRDDFGTFVARRRE